MKPLTLEEVVAAVEGTCNRPVPAGSVARVVSDSREVRPGDLFVAIRGARMDGHDFVGKALAARAVGALVRDDFDLASVGPDAGSSPGAAVIRVDDPVAAMGRLARHYRRTEMAGSVTVVAVTGSNGKTTTKTMIAHVLSARWRGRGSIKSYNNAIGVPLTLLAVEPSDEFVVCEVGTNAPGEIAALARIVEPEVAVITGVSEAHLEGLGSLEGVAREKSDLLRYMRADGCGIYNADCQVLAGVIRSDYDLRRSRLLTFGRCPEADLRLTDVRVEAGDPAGGLPAGMVFTVNDRFRYRLGVLGRHNVVNAMAAIAVARRFGMDHEEIAARLAGVELPPLRLQVERPGRITLINDCYNANPASMSAALDVLTDMPAAGRRVLIVGDMRELGADSERLHRELGERIGGSQVDLVVAVGENARTIRQAVERAGGGRIAVRAYAGTRSARIHVPGLLRPGDTVLIKGSRALALERVAERIREWACRPGGRAGAARRSTGPARRRASA